ncbi:glycosyltransferase family 4 protein [Methylacidiphilum caldifontis]|uniref:glycosyltransferase family 4 protein n=1 Tax=Methylacidiphilum caldifontis TaxID=2795386 RepID=UPI001A8D845A|nr:glycosyltransferase family 4 protein [Methylacidiphilum caldifontis]QSR89367.1 glycosyltransferase family 4 protein [Methylacidiphilum caldifontis]
MRIAQVASLYEPVPPPRYGGTERIISYLTEELVKAGHEVCLFASGDSKTSSRLYPIIPKALWEDTQRCVNPQVYHVLLLEEVLKHKDQFDIIHFHTDFFHFPIVRRLDVPHLTTPHGRMDFPEYIPFFREFQDIPLSSISHVQRQGLALARWVGTVHHGLPLSLYQLSENPSDYIVFLGRISPEKGVDDALAIARMAGLKLKIAARVGLGDDAYFEKLLPEFKKKNIEYLGEITDKEKNELLGGALALLFPVCWPEPFGLSMIEAMACGTPVIAYPQGSIPEVVDHGITGFIVQNVQEAVNVLSQIHTFNRKQCRERFEKRFSAQKMAESYISLYQKVIAEKRK